jgi:8-oxo-dGTP pyrophosphatase MutT (NUDIX family)
VEEHLSAGTDVSAASPKPPVIHQTSAGGVIYQKKGRDILVAIISVGDTARWQLPKGLVEEAEAPEAAALRETREEAGVDGSVESKLDTVEYWYVGKQDGQRVRFHKLVHFFLMRYEKGDVARHDQEVNEARWVPIAEAMQMLAFRSEKKVMQQAKAVLNSANVHYH